jgi:N-acetylmuramoyl-L-alanine amidase
LKIENTSGKYYSDSCNVLEYKGVKDYGTKTGYNPIPLNLCEQVINDISLDFGGLDIKFFNFDNRLMLTNMNGELNGAEYNGRAYHTHIIIGARNEKDIKLGGVSGIGSLIIHELGHAIMYKSMDCTYENHMTNAKFKEYVSLREIPSTFTDKSIWEKRPAEIFAEDFRYLFGKDYMKEEEFLPYKHISKPSTKIKQFMLDLMISIGVKELPIKITPSESDIIIPTTPTQPKTIKITNVDTATVPNFLLILNGGHGMDTAGKRTPLFPDGTFIRENQFNDAVVEKIKYICEKMGVAYHDVSAETNDVALATVVSREKAARKAYLVKYPKAKTLFLSVHYNAIAETWDGSTASGLEVWHYSTSTEGKRIADNILNELKKGTTQVNRGIKSSETFYVLKNTASPAVLVECGFMDDKREAELMLNDKFQQEVALELFNGAMNSFGLKTTGWVIYDENIMVKQPDVIVTPPNTTPPTTNTPVEKTPLKLIKTRYKSTDVFYVEVPLSEYWIYPTLGVKGKLEKLSDIVNGFESRTKTDVRVACNAGFFNLDGSAEHLGNFIVNFGKEPVYQYSPSANFIDFVSYKNGRFECRKNSIPTKELIALKSNINFAMGVSYSLIIDGKINIVNGSKFSHSKTNNPRTMVGWNQTKNTFIIAVADGRKTGTLGLNAIEEAEFMLSLGCTVAVNFDGGGSSQLIFDNGGDRDLIANKPSDGVERKIGSALVAYSK